MTHQDTNPVPAAGLADRLRETTEEMANRASVPMELWSRHCNACLEAIATLSPAPAGEPWAVKPLEWTGEESGPGHDIEAEPTPYLRYAVRCIDDGEFDAILNTDTGSIWFRERGETHGSYAAAKAAAQADYEKRIRSALVAPPFTAGVEKAIAKLRAEAAEAEKIAERDGYEKAVQDIDMMTGGDGEYRYCTNHDPERHCPDPETMKARIADRFDASETARQEAERQLAEARAEVEAMRKWLSNLRKQTDGLWTHPTTRHFYSVKGIAEGLAEQIDNLLSQPSPETKAEGQGGGA